MSNLCDYDRYSFIVIEGNLQLYQGNDTHVEIPDCVTKVSKAAFKNKLNIQSIVVPGSIQNLGINTFSEVFSLKELILKPGSAKFTTINGALCSADGQKLLMVPRGLEAYEIPESITEVGKEAFCGCHKMKSIVFPATVTTIGANIFGYSSPLHIMVRNSSAVIHEEAFYMDSLEKCFLYGTLELPTPIMKSVMTSIKRKKKTYLEKIIQADDGTAMDRFLSLWKTPTAEELDGYIHMAELAQSANILKLLQTKYNACGDSNGALEIHVDDEDTLKNWRKKLKLSVSNGSITVTGYNGTAADVVIPKEIEGIPVVDIKSRAFFVRRFIKSVQVLSSISTIRTGTFGACSSLETVALPEHLVTIGKEAFHGCEKLKTANIPETVTSIDDYAFYGCIALENITIPNSVTVIGTSVFAKCDALRCVSLSDNMEEIPLYLFNECSSLEEIVIPHKVTKINSYAFAGCSSLRKIVISENVRHIDHSAFFNCKNLTIYTTAGSYAETYAKENNIPFVAE